MNRWSAVTHLERLGRNGLTVSVCCGPCGAEDFRWSVNVLNRSMEEFDMPFAANSFAHAVEIAEIECRERGWVSE